MNGSVPGKDMDTDADTRAGVPSAGPMLVLHVVGGLSGQGGVMSFVEQAAGLPVEGVSQRIWKHRDFRADSVGKAAKAGAAEGEASGWGATGEGRYVCAGVATATDLGMVHDLRAGIREARVLRRWLRGRRGVILHAHSRVGMLAAAWGGGGFPLAVHLHKISGQPWIYRALVRWRGAHWVFNSQRTRDHHGIAANQATVIYPPISWPAEPAPGDSGVARIVAAGAYVRVKQFDRLLAAVGLLRREGVTVPVEIVGRSTPPIDPVHDRELEALATTIGGVTLAGYASAWASRLRAGDVFVHAGDIEAYGIVILEAYGRGCRVVVPPVSVLDELGARGDGVFVAASTRPEDLAAALRRALADRGEASGRWRERRGVSGRVSVEECVCQLRGLYRSLAGTKSTDGTATT